MDFFTNLERFCSAAKSKQLVSTWLVVVGVVAVVAVGVGNGSNMSNGIGNGTGNVVSGG